MNGLALIRKGGDTMQRAVLVVTGPYDTDKASKLVKKLAAEYGSDGVTATAWSQTPDIPEWVSVHLADQLLAHKRDTEDGRIMTIWMGSDQEIEDLALNGDPLERD